jgi:signal transduction histidine kinase
VHAVTSGETTSVPPPAAATVPARRRPPWLSWLSWRSWRSWPSWSPAGRPLPAPAADVLVAAVVAFPTFMDAWWNEAGTRQADGITYALAAASIGALLVRRRRPVAVALACGIVLTAWYLMDHHGEMLNLPTMVALYTVAVQGDRRRSVRVGLVAAAWSGTLGYTDSDPAGAPGGSPILEMLWPLIPLVLGEAVRTRHELLDEYAARAVRAEAEQEREARHRVQAERLRIAREFHDVVAHTMAAVNVQMGVAAAAFDTRPAAARQALVQARRSSREALHELRATVALLRDGEPDDAAEAGRPDAAPAPRLADVAELAARTRAAGLVVTVDDTTAGRDLPATVELAAYRIVQEALANVLRHAGAERVAVTLRATAGGLVVEVVDDGSGADPAAAGARGGFGLRGMAERTAALGGTVEHGPGPDRGFRVAAHLPLDAGPPPEPRQSAAGPGRPTRSPEAGASPGAGPPAEAGASDAGSAGAEAAP